MAPQSRREELESLDMESLDAKEAAVLCLIYPRNRRSHVVFILRNAYPGVHSRQIGFPGGRREEHDDSFLATAIRETEEEIGVIGNDVEPITHLSRLFIPPSNFIVYPFLGFMEDEPVFKPEPSEVDDIIEVELDHILGENTISTENLSTSYAKNINVNCFRYQDKVIWGATAMILSEVRAMMLNLK